MSSRAAPSPSSATLRAGPASSSATLRRQVTNAPEPGVAALPVEYSGPAYLGESPGDFDAKARRAFDEFSVSRSRAAGLPQWTEAFTRLHIGFSPATVGDLFRSADADDDGVVTYEEWKRFVMWYPTLLDMLYYRACDLASDHAGEREVQDARARLEQRRDEERAAAAAVAAAEAELQAQAEVRRQAEEKVGALDDAAAAQERAVAQAAEAEEQGRAELRDRGAELEGAKVAQQLRAAERRDAAAAVDQRQCDLRAADDEVAAKNAEILALEQALHDRRRELQHLQQAREDTRRAVDAAEGAVRAISATAADAGDGVQSAAERVAAAELVVRSLGQHRAAADDDLQRRRAAADQERGKVGDAARAVEHADSRLRQRQADAAGAVAASAAQQERCAELEAEAAEDTERRERLRQQEQVLLDQEVRLREQRKTLESRELVLRSAARAHAGGRPRAPPPQPAVSAPPTPATTQLAPGEPPPLPPSRDRSRETFREPSRDALREPSWGPPPSEPPGQPGGPAAAGCARADSAPEILRVHTAEDVRAAARRVASGVPPSPPPSAPAGAFAAAGLHVGGGDALRGAGRGFPGGGYRSGLPVRAGCSPPRVRGGFPPLPPHPPPQHSPQPSEYGSMQSDVAAWQMHNAWRSALQQQQVLSSHALAVDESLSGSPRVHYATIA